MGLVLVNGKLQSVARKGKRAPESTLLPTVQLSVHMHEIAVNSTVHRHSPDAMHRSWVMIPAKKRTVDADERMFLGGGGVLAPAC